MTAAAAVALVFGLKKVKAKVAHLNVRDEKHGDDPVLAVDVKISADVPNTFLDSLGHGMRAALYRGEGEKAGETFDIELDHMPVLRFPQLAPIKWRAGLVGCKFIVHGPKKADDVLFEADVKDLDLEPKEGGTVALTFKASVLPTSEELAKLGEWLGHETKVSIEHVEQPEQPPLEKLED